MADSEFLAYATAGGANVEAQATFVADSQLGPGVPQGAVARSAFLNKLWRQSSFISAVLAQTIANLTGSDVDDDGDLSALVTRLSGLFSGASTPTTYSIKTANYTVTSTDAGTILYIDATGGNVVVTLPTPSTVDGLKFSIVRIDNSSNTVEISGTVNSSSGYALNSAGYSATIHAFNGSIGGSAAPGYWLL